MVYSSNDDITLDNRKDIIINNAEKKNINLNKRSCNYEYDEEENDDIIKNNESIICGEEKKIYISNIEGKEKNNLNDSNILEKGTSRSSSSNIFKNIDKEHDRKENDRLKDKEKRDNMREEKDYYVIDKQMNISNTHKINVEKEKIKNNDFRMNNEEINFDDENKRNNIFDIKKSISTNDNIKYTSNSHKKGFVNTNETGRNDMNIIYDDNNYIWDINDKNDINDINDEYLRYEKNHIINNGHINKNVKNNDNNMYYENNENPYKKECIPTDEHIKVDKVIVDIKDEKKEEKKNIISNKDEKKNFISNKDEKKNFISNKEEKKNFISNKEEKKNFISNKEEKKIFISNKEEKKNFISNKEENGKKNKEHIINKVEEAPGYEYSHNIIYHELYVELLHVNKNLQNEIKNLKKIIEMQKILIKSKEEVFLDHLNEKNKMSNKKLMNHNYFLNFFNKKKKKSKEHKTPFKEEYEEEEDGEDIGYVVDRKKQTYFDVNKNYHEGKRELEEEIHNVSEEHFDKKGSYLECEKIYNDDEDMFEYDMDIIYEKEENKNNKYIKLPSIDNNDFSELTDRDMDSLYADNNNNMNNNRNNNSNNNNNNNNSNNSNNHRNNNNNSNIINIDNNDDVYFFNDEKEENNYSRKYEFEQSMLYNIEVEDESCNNSMTIQEITCLTFWYEEILPLVNNDKKKNLLINRMITNYMPNSIKGYFWEMCIKNKLNLTEYFVQILIKNTNFIQAYVYTNNRQYHNHVSRYFKSLIVLRNNSLNIKEETNENDQDDAQKPNDDNISFDSNKFHINEHDKYYEQNDNIFSEAKNMFDHKNDNTFDNNKNDPFDNKKDDPFDNKKDDPFDNKKNDPFDNKKNDHFDNKKNDPCDNKKDDPFDNKNDNPFDNKKDDHLGDNKMNNMPNSNANINLLQKFSVQKFFYQILIDLDRTMYIITKNKEYFEKYNIQTDNVLSSVNLSDMKKKLNTLLQMYVLFKPELGYVQGMSYIALVFLLYTNLEKAFVHFANFMERKDIYNLYSFNKEEIKIYIYTIKQILTKRNIEVYKEIIKHYNIDNIFIQWIYTIFLTCLPFNIYIRLFDIYTFNEKIIYEVIICIFTYFNKYHPTDNVDIIIKDLSSFAFNSYIKEEKFWNLLKKIKIKKRKILYYKDKYFNKMNSKDDDCSIEK
ncbi:putative GTPase-activating protein [Plasmodium gaboni]|uniref:Putative GTPase-activating protein n=1 Tax=Plasmodium gaboni TaxID=647221 RepID=A0A151L9M9_9APIC|nr:putative GTPase-activating protein [Plasmodium gaboni]KYN95663.1 putative GTPase-activating protein [Plasmodium gaboni]